MYVNKRIGVALALMLLVVVAFVTNPTAADFGSYVDSKLQEEVSKDTGTGVLDWFMGKIVTMGIRAMTQRQNYGLFSLYKVRLPGDTKNFKVIGAFGTFLPLSDIKEFEGAIKSDK